MSGELVVQMRDVGVRFDGGYALAGIDLDIHAGERVAVIGPSGAGKSSLISSLNGTIAVTEGTVRVLGLDYATASVRELRQVQRRLGTIHQQFDLVEQLRCVHNVNAGRLGSWSVWKAALSLIVPRDLPRVVRALERVGIKDKLHARTGDLSGGEQQRVAIARVLVQEPAAILADEPVASLDPARGKEIINLLHDISIEAGMTFLASLHDVRMALDRFNRIIGLRGGRIAFDTVPDRLGQPDFDALYALERRRSPR
jgi:phosphonate transport system ATP-binding protein